MAPAGPRRRPKSAFSPGRPSCRLCIKSAIGEFSADCSGSGFANPSKQKNPPARSGSRSALFRLPRCPELQIRENGRRPFVENPADAPCAGGACTPPNPLCLTPRHPEIGQHRPSEGVFFLGIGRNSAERRKKPPLGSKTPFFGRWARTAQAVLRGLEAAETARGTHSHGTRQTGAAGSRPAM